MPLTLAKDNEVGLVYRIDGKSYAVLLTREQHEVTEAIENPFTLVDFIPLGYDVTPETK